LKEFDELGLDDDAMTATLAGNARKLYGLTA
jgi:hypothetical protein